MKILLILTAGLFVLLSFTKPGKPVRTLKEMQKATKGMYAYIPSGKTIVDGDTIDCKAFFMLKGEVSNFNYLEYLYALKKDGKTAEYNAALPDTVKWSSGKALNSKYTQYYFRHPAYREYPVVNITREQAEGYCTWLTEVWKKQTGNNGISFRLPTRSEFLRAANGTNIERPYSWGFPFLTNTEGKSMCNFMNIGAGSISRDSTGKLVVVPTVYYFDGVAGSLSDGADLTSPVHSFYKNEFGLFNLNGNVSEMVAGEDIVVGGDWNSPGYDIRNQSKKNYKGAEPVVGFRPVMTFVEKSE